jgi:hypothetical protein
MFFTFSPIVGLFKNHSVAVIGMKGTGKDVLMGNVIARRSRLEYVSNCDYGYKFHKFDYNTLIPNAYYLDMINGKVKYYKFPYPDYTDVYLSDVGTYFPSQYCNEINKLFPNLATYNQISRHLGESKLHWNTQALNRCYDKLREHSDRYIYCEWLFKPLMKIGVVLQSVIIYDKYDSALNRVKPCRIKTRLFMNEQARTQTEIYLDDFYNKHGSVKRKILIYFNRSKHDTRFFKEMFLKGEKK